jgi:adenosylcobinamide amidohydrolase
MIEGVAVTVDGEAVVVVADRALDVLSSAPVHGGVVRAQSLVNLHVMANFSEGDLDARIDGFARARDLPSPWVGFFTAARTENAEIAHASVSDVTAIAAVTVGLSHPIAAGVAPRATPARAVGVVTRAPAGTINTIVIVDAAIDTSALVNAVAVIAEIKASVLAAAGVRADGAVATGTATDAIAIAATGRGARHRFGGAATTPGEAIARAARIAIERGVARWLESHR